MNFSYVRKGRQKNRQPAPARQSGDYPLASQLLPLAARQM
jgi:hypothetical protein